MTSRDLSRLMWSEALSLLEQADRLQRQFIRPATAASSCVGAAGGHCRDRRLGRVHVALPGTAADSIAVKLEPGAITISAHRPFPIGASESQCAARIHALEIPYGRFERRIGLPTQALTLSGRKLQDGCLTLIFSKKESS